MTTRMHSLNPFAALVAVSASLAAAPSMAAEYWLDASETAKTVATAAGDNAVVMWEYANCTANYASCSAPSAPGPILRVPAGQPLVIHVRNALSRAGSPVALSHVAAYEGAPVPVSIQIPGLTNARFAAGAVGACTAATAPVESGGRVRSFTSEVANGAIGTYCWDTRPGTFVYQSGTHPQVQVQMGLYGAVVVDGSGCTGTRCAYAGVAYDREVLAIYSEIDPALHAAVAGDTYGDETAANPKTSTIVYSPQYFFVDGAADGVAFTSLADVSAGITTDRVLIRLANAGIESHAPLLAGAYVTPVAEDGNPYDASLLGRRQYSTLLAAGKTVDAIFLPPAAGSFALLDRRRMTANAASASSGGGVASGMLLRLSIGASP